MSLFFSSEAFEDIWGDDDVNHNVFESFGSCPWTVQAFCRSLINKTSQHSVFASNRPLRLISSSYTQVELPPGTKASPFFARCLWCFCTKWSKAHESKGAGEKAPFAPSWKFEWALCLSSERCRKITQGLTFMRPKRLEHVLMKIICSARIFFLMQIEVGWGQGKSPWFC